MKGEREGREGGREARLRSVIPSMNICAQPQQCQCHWGHVNGRVGGVMDLTIESLVPPGLVTGLGRSLASMEASLVALSGLFRVPVSVCFLPNILYTPLLINFFV